MRELFDELKRDGSDAIHRWKLRDLLGRKLQRWVERRSARSLARYLTAVI